MNAVLPIVDLASDDAAVVMDRACREVGFFYVVGHGVDDALLRRLEDAAREFFARSDADKAAISMDRGGTAWRGWFPVGGELTSGVPDRKEGIYFGREDETSDVPLHGPNLFPVDSGLRDAVLPFLDQMTALGRRLLRMLGVDVALYRDPTILFRIFHYPPARSPERQAPDGGWGVGEHTDYGLLTMLCQDATAGLQVRARDGSWIDAPPIEGSFVCNIGDMLERLSGGAYRSTPHRVRNTSDVGRLSFPFFFDPSWDAVVPVPKDSLPSEQRWDGADPFTFEGTYGDYLTAKVAKVFPALASSRLRAEGR